ncbi:MAG TPA: hypothetical protein VGR07_15660 [Thermoanaerobaculia bacterium]|jgi:hypothetical protein|nr:hypothetical protein [Thermoanaerobaculia bacterium]
MHDLDTLSAILFVTLFVLTIVIGVLGISLLTRLARVNGGRRPVLGCGPGPLLVTLALLGVAWMAIFLPYLSVVPALLFFFFGARALGGGRGFPREGGAVLLLVGLAWALYTAYQAIMAAWSLTVSAPIRIDILLVLPVMGVISYLGWQVQSSLAEGGRLSS